MRAKVLLTTLFQTLITDLGFNWSDKMTIEPPKDKKFGDFAANCALVLAKEAGRNPRELAALLAEKLQSASPYIGKVEIAGPGFLNVTYTPAFWQEYIPLVETSGQNYGASTVGTGIKMQVEFVSANPTGPLHIGHGRGAAVGDSLVRILRFAGYTTEAEYYINDAGNQMHTLGKSIWLRALELAGKQTESFPEDCYQGNYIIDMAKHMLDQHSDLLSLSPKEGIALCGDYGMKTILTEIREDLQAFGVHHDCWFSEKSLVQAGKIETAFAAIQSAGYSYEKDGALWFETTKLGDDKDRVLKKSDGSLTYFASDIAYHVNKYDRGFDTVIDIWGADHHGYIPRMRAAIEAIGKTQDNFDVILVQLVNLLRDGKQIAMSTRAGQFETLRDVVNEVGVDAARFIFLSRKSDSKLDFDLDLVKQRTMDNPVYYVQYAHARIHAVLRRAAEQGIVIHDDNTVLQRLTLDEELELLRWLDRFPQIAQEAAQNHAPHYISYFLIELAGLLHRYYATYQILGSETTELIIARLRLLRAIGQTLHNGLSLLGVSAPQSM